MSRYTKANTDWLAACRVGIGIHWTAQTAPRRGAPLPFPEALNQNVERCREMQE